MRENVRTPNPEDVGSSPTNPAKRRSKMAININCKFYDYGGCDHPEQKSFLWIFRRECILLRNPCGKCKLQEEYPRPRIRGIKSGTKDGG